ncbi:Arrestin domain-containing protein 3 [Nymphon striatum]|nr:Arrestin domain-containing protein 3 [Nymphon striatum]
MGRLKSFEITFDNNRTVFLPGQHVRGKCVVNLKGSVKIRAITIVMKGVAKVHWSEPRSFSSGLGRHTEHYNAEIEYFSKRLVLCGIEGALTATEVLSEGRHEYPFSFQLPSRSQNKLLLDFSSGVSTSFEGTHGSIRYWMKAEIDKPWSFNHSTKKAFTVISESIAIRADFENLSRRKVIPYATLYQTQTFVAGGKTRNKKNKLTAVKGGTIQPGKTIQWAAQLLKIPVVSPSISNCSLIKIDYFVRVSLQISGSADLFVDLPVVIGTVPYRRSTSNQTLSHHIPSAITNLPAYTNHFSTLPSYRELTGNCPSLYYEGIENQKFSLLAMLFITTAPPTYAESMEGPVDITDNDQGIIGDTFFTAYIDPHPTPTLNQT